MRRLSKFTSRAGPWLARACEALWASRLALPTLLLSLASLVIVIAVVRETISTAPVIYPVSLPEPLVRLGYSGEGMAAGIRWEVLEMRRKVANGGDGAARDMQNPRASEAQFDIQVPGVGFSLRTIVHWLRRELGMAEPGVFTEIRCTDAKATSGSKAPPKMAGKVAGECDPLDLSVDIIIADAEGPGTMHRVRRDHMPITGTDALIARELALYFTPAMLGAYLEDEQNELIANCKGPGEFELARRAYERASVLGEREPSALKRWFPSRGGNLWERGQLGLASVLQSRADEKREQGLDDEATELLEEAKELAMTVVVARPKSALAKVVLANTLFRLRSDDKEIEDTFDKAEKDDPGFAEGYALHAYVDYFMKRYEKAVERNQRALRENPDLPIVHSNLGYSYLKLGRFDEALRSFEEAQRRDPFWSDWAGLGEALLGKENYRRAIAQLKRASEKRWCDTRTRLLMAKAYLGSGDPETALKVARKAVKDSTAYAEAYQLIAQAQAQLDHEIEAAASYEEAIRLLKEGQTIDEGDGAASIYLDYAEMIQDSDAPKLQKMKRAERVLRDGITANQERPKQVAILQTALGIALSAQGRDGEAEREFLAATQADPKNRGALVSLADVQERLERNRIH